MLVSINFQTVKKGWFFVYIVRGYGLYFFFQKYGISFSDDRFFI